MLLTARRCHRALTATATVTARCQLAALHLLAALCFQSVLTPPRPPRAPSLPFQAYTKAKVEFPIVADKSRQIAYAYNMLDASEVLADGSPMSVRTVFIIGPDKKLKLHLAYPASTGRNFDEIIRVIDSLQLTAKYKVATPVNWQQGGSCMLTPGVKADEDGGYSDFPKGVTVEAVPSQKAYLRTTPQPDHELPAAAAAAPAATAAAPAAAAAVPAKVLRIGDEVPNFDAETSMGPLNLHTHLGSSWGILFSHPNDFTPVCTTELGMTASLKAEFDSRDVKFIGLSCNTSESHQEWIADINVTRPLWSHAAHRPPLPPRSHRHRHRHRAVPAGRTAFAGRTLFSECSDPPASPARSVAAVPGLHQSQSGVPDRGRQIQADRVRLQHA